jgi:hypothetical protein
LFSSIPASLLILFMVTARVTEFAFKVLLVVFLLAYLSIYFGTDKHNRTNIKSYLINSSACGVVVGGSNAMNGISAGDLSSDGCSFVNLAVGNESGRSFDYYLDWVIEIQSNAKVVIYSPAYFWSSSNNKINDFDDYSLLGLKNKSMARYLIELIKSEESSGLYLNGSGDIISYSCNTHFPPFEIAPGPFSTYDHVIAENLLSRLLALKTRLKADFVFLKVPPLYVGDGLVSEVEALAKRRLELIRARSDAVIIDDEFVFSQVDHFCDSVHSNEKGRRVFTENIKKSIASYLSIMP